MDISWEGGADGFCCIARTKAILFCSGSCAMAIGSFLRTRTNAASPMTDKSERLNISGTGRKGEAAVYAAKQGVV